MYSTLKMIGLVLVTEMFNTAVEKLVDLFGTEEHPVAGIVKDVAAGAVDDIKSLYANVS